MTHSPLTQSIPLTPTTPHIAPPPAGSPILPARVYRDLTPLLCVFDRVRPDAALVRTAVES